MIWFTSDEHYGHENIIKYCNRPFSSISEMNSEIARRHNEVVKNGDTVYHLGDFTLGNIDHFWSYAEHLNGNHFVLQGSHDHRWINDFQEAHVWSGNTLCRWQMLEPLTSLEFPKLGKDNYPLVIVLCHYGLRVWDRSHYGSINLYGHSHGHLSAYGLRAMDVGVDCHNFYPVSLDYVVQKLVNDWN